VKKLTGGFDNGLGAISIGEHSLASFLSKKSPEGISGLFQQYRSSRDKKTCPRRRQLSPKAAMAGLLNRRLDVRHVTDFGRFGGVAGLC
jgi:hypothetical protein